MNTSESMCIMFLVFTPGIARLEADVARNSRKPTTDWLNGIDVYSIQSRACLVNK